MPDDDQELRAVIADLRRDQAADLRQERDKWQAAFEREQGAHATTQRLLLPAPIRMPDDNHQEWHWGEGTKYALAGC